MLEDLQADLLYLQLMPTTHALDAPGTLYNHCFTWSTPPHLTCQRPMFFSKGMPSVESIEQEQSLRLHRQLVKIYLAFMKSRHDSKPLVLSMMHQTESRGRLFLSQAPGKHLQRGRDGKPYFRDLSTDLRQFLSAGISHILCLLNPSELRSIGVDPDKYSVLATELGLHLFTYPIIEMSTPEDISSFESQAMQPLLECINSGQSILVHCRGGIGRAGLVAACALLRLGQATGPRMAIHMVRIARDRRCVESRKQEDFIALYFREVCNLKTL